MCTLFDLIRLLATVGCAAVLGALGWNTFGILGGVVGAPLGIVCGAMIGQLPLVVGLKWIALRFDRMTDEQLIDELHNPTCLIPNLLLLELRRRGSDIRQELPYVQALLAAEDMRHRMAGWAALHSVFPELAGKIPEYRPTATAAECRAKCEPLLSQIAQHGEPESPARRESKS